MTSYVENVPKVKNLVGGVAIQLLVTSLSYWIYLFKKSGKLFTGILSFFLLL